MQNLIQKLTEKNKLCQDNGFQFCTVSDLEGFSDTLEAMQQYIPLVCVSDVLSGSISLDNAPATRTIQTVFLFMPHDIQENYMANRQRCFSIMREIFRQFMTVLLLEITDLRLQGIYLDRDVQFTEIDKYFFSGGACAYFQLVTDRPTDLRLNPDEWTECPIPQKTGRLDANTPRPSTIHF